MLSEEGIIIENFFMIPDKTGRDVPFALNNAQLQVDFNLTGRDIVPKARQEGVSSYVLAKFTVKCLYKRNTRAAVISHDHESTERLFKRVHYFIENFRGPKPLIKGTGSKREITFTKTNSSFYIGTAGSRKFGRGDMITDLHCSEVAFWENPKELFSGLSDAVPVESGTIILESTGNGHNWYYQRVQDVLDNRSPYKIHFLDWQNFPEYDLSCTDEEKEIILSTLDSEYEEDILWEKGLLTVGQLKFRRLKLAEKDWDLQLFKQEYPMSLDECFQATSTGLFNKVNYRPDYTDWKIEYKTATQSFYRDITHPRPGHHYVLGLDPSEGVGQDNAIIEVVCLETATQVGEWTSNKLEQDIQGNKLVEFGYEYNQGFLIIERNRGQVAIRRVLESSYPTIMVYREKPSKSRPTSSFGLNVTVSSKPLIIGMLRTHLRDTMTIYSPALKSELDTFHETETGRLEASPGCKDDRVMALAMCVAGFHKAALYMGDYSPPQQQILHSIDPFTLDSIINELRRGNNIGLPIKPQARLL